VVFVPLALIIGMVGNFLREYSLVVVFSTLMSLLVSFTITPMLASRFTRLEHLTKGTLMGRFGLWFDGRLSSLSKFYISILKWSLNHRASTVLISIILLFLSVALVPLGFIGNEFIPVVDRGELIITIELEPGASIEHTNHITNIIERKLYEIPEVDKVLANVGMSSEGFMGMTSNNTSELNISLVDKKKRKESTEIIGQKMKHIIQEIPGVKVRVSPVSLMGTSTRTPVQILVSGTKYENVQKGGE